MRNSLFWGRTIAARGLIRDMSAWSTAYFADGRPMEFLVGCWSRGRQPHSDRPLSRCATDLKLHPPRLGTQTVERQKSNVHAESDGLFKPMAHSERAILQRKVARFHAFLCGSPVNSWRDLKTVKQGNSIRTSPLETFNRSLLRSSRCM